MVRSVVARCGQSVRLCCREGHITPASPELCSSSKLKYRSNYEPTPTEGKCYFNHEIVNIIVLKYLTVKVYLQDTCS